MDFATTHMAEIPPAPLDPAGAKAAALAANPAQAPPTQGAGLRPLGLALPHTEGDFVGDMNHFKGRGGDMPVEGEY